MTATTTALRTAPATAQTADWTATRAPRGAAMLLSTAITFAVLGGLVQVAGMEQQSAAQTAAGLYATATVTSVAAG